jgi:hypothetical protein
MSVSDESNYTIENTSEMESSKLLKIIGKLAGNKPNLKVSFQELKFNRGNTKYLLNGEINFNIFRPKDAIALILREEGEHAKTKQ